MDATPCQITDFFNGTRQMLIPLFQRPYEWTKKEWSALWEDLLDRYESFDTPSSVSHFTGALVMTSVRTNPVGVSKCLVIDGQQRITTIALILCALRSFFDEKDKIYRKITKLLVNEDDDGDDFYKILPTQPDRPGYTELLERGEDASNTSFKQAFDFFRRKIGGKDSDGNQIDPKKLFNTIQGRISVVSILLGENDDPYLIFESLNAKGAPLTQGDLVRNYLLLRIQSEKQPEIYKKHWLPIQQRLEKTLPEFIRQYLVMETAASVRKGEVYLTLKNLLGDRDDAAIPEYIEILGKYSCYYNNILKGQETNPKLAERLARIERWGLTTCHPLMLKLYGLYAAGELSVSDFCGCLVDIESFVVRRAICRVPTNQLKRLFISFTKNLDTQRPRRWLAETLMDGQHGRRWPDDKELEKEWPRWRAYTTPIERCRMILESIEESYGHKEAASFKKATLEHIMPQTLTEEWRKSLGDNAEGEQQLWLDTIGNLTLTGYNSELSNSSFKKKKELFKESNFVLNRFLLDHAKWGPSEIELRAKHLLPVAKKLWPRPS